jgi:predicted MFS family arabinose efflux permease
VQAERTAADPIIPLHLFRERNFTVPTVAGLLMAVAMFGAVAYLPTYLQMVTRLTPTQSGMVLLTLIAGIGLSTVGSAQVVSRTGSYRWLPVAGSILAALALALMSSLSVQSGLHLIGAYLFLLGTGMGCCLQILVVVVQNTVSASEVGTATAANSFFREIGVSMGVAVVGTVFTSRLHELIAERVPPSLPGLDPATVTPEALRELPVALQSAIAASYHDALTPVLLCLVPLLVLSAVGLCLVRPVPLATTVSA